jgi:plastocyanin
MNKPLLGGIIAIVIIAAAVLFMNGSNNNNDDVTPTPTPAQTPTPTPTPDPTPLPTPTPQPGPAPTPTPTPNPTSQPQTHTISMTDAGFSVGTLTINKGDTVTFKNNGTKAIWPASAPHPTHTDYPEFDPKQAVAVGGSWSFTFTKVGTWRYHDHLNSTRFGTIIVK